LIRQLRDFRAVRFHDVGLEDEIRFSTPSARKRDELTGNDRPPGLAADTT
jgi:hypothetical protein